MSGLELVAVWEKIVKAEGMVLEMIRQTNRMPEDERSRLMKEAGDLMMKAGIELKQMK